MINGIAVLKEKLMKDKSTTEIFAKEISVGSIRGIVRSVYQSFSGVDVYESIEEKAANLLYLMVKNHPYIDGNKRSGAFSFLWFLKKANLLNTLKMNPEVLTTLTILIAESKTEEKERVIGIVLLLLKK
jgi:prophage maintenance system killer protein